MHGYPSHAVATNLWIVDVVGHRELSAYLNAEYERYRQRLIEIGFVK